MVRRRGGLCLVGLSGRGASITWGDQLAGYSVSPRGGRHSLWETKASRRGVVAGAAALMAAPLLAACSSDDSKDESNKGSAKSLDKVRYITTFGKVGRDAFAWVAREKGYFKDAGLDVAITPGKATGENIKALASGQIDIANCDIVGAWILAGQGSYKEFRTFAAIHQQSLVAIISLEGNGITSPKDLENKQIAAASNSVNQLLFPAYAKLAGVDASKVTWKNLDTTQLTPALANGSVPAVSTFLLGQKGIEKATKKKAVILPYSTYLTDLFGNGLVASTKFVKEKPDVIKRFRDAAMKAVQFSVAQPKEAAEILHAAEPSADVDAAIGEITAMAPYVTVGLSNNQPVGTIDQAKVSRTIAIMESAGLVPTGSLKAEDVVDFDLTPKASS